MAQSLQTLIVTVSSNSNSNSSVYSSIPQSLHSLNLVIFPDFFYDGNCLIFVTVICNKFLCVTRRFTIFHNQRNRLNRLPSAPISSNNCRHSGHSIKVNRCNLGRKRSLLCDDVFGTVSVGNLSLWHLLFTACTQSAYSSTAHIGLLCAPAFQIVHPHPGLTLWEDYS